MVRLRAIVAGKRLPQQGRMAAPLPGPVGRERSRSMITIDHRDRTDGQDQR